MSCAGGRFPTRSLAVRSVSGSASTKAAWRTSLKLAVVEMSSCMREGRSARAHTTPESVEMSPDCRPCVMIGRSSARLTNGRAMPPLVVKAVAAALVARNVRRVVERTRIVIRASASHIDQESWSGSLTDYRRQHDGLVTGLISLWVIHPDNIRDLLNHPGKGRKRRRTL